MDNDQVASSVAELTQAVEGMREGLVDRETVETIVADALAAAREGGSGYTPPDAGDEGAAFRGLQGSFAQRMTQLHTRRAAMVAPMIGRDAEVVEEFQRASDRLLILTAAIGGDPRELSYYEDQFLPAVRAMDTETAGEGQEWVPRSLSANLIERVNLALRVVQLFPEIPMPTNPFDVPGLAVARTRGGRHTEQTADTGQTKIKKVTAGTRKITLTARRFATEILTSKDVEEDSIIAVLDLIEDELGDFTAADLEDAAINGDTTGIAGSHRDSDSDAADDPRINWDGLRKVADAVNAEQDGGNVKLTAKRLLANRGLMGKYGVADGATGLVHVISVQSYLDLIGDDAVQTVDKYGAGATILTGELGRSHGVPLIPSEYVREDLNATGKHDGVTTNRSVALTVHKRGFVRGSRRAVGTQTLTELYAESDQDAVVITTRQAFESRYPGEKVVAATFNVGPGVDPA